MRVKGISGVICLIFFTFMTSAWPSSTYGAEEPGPIPVEAWVHEPVLTGLELSPDGRHIVGLTPHGADAVPVITIWDADDLSRTPRLIELVAANRARWKPQTVTWLNDEQIYVVGAQLLDARLGGRTILTFNTKAFVYHMGRERFAEPFGGGGTRLQDLISETAIFRRLPRDPNRVLVIESTREGAVNIYEMRLDRNYATRRVFRGATGASVTPDLAGNIRARSRFEPGPPARVELDVRAVGSNQWQTISQLNAREREGLTPIGFSGDPDVLFMADNTGREFSVIREYKISTGELSEPIFAHAQFDARSVILGSSQKKDGQILGFRFDGPQSSVYWVDADRRALVRALNEVFPDKSISLGSFSDDERRAIVVVSASNDPGTYFLYDVDRGLIELGRPFPLLNPQRLPETQFVSYIARDGMRIPAFITVPLRGQAPFPAVVMPHGGPWSRDYMGFDPWRQFLADRGYVVLQPQFRGTLGFGQSLWRAGDREWGGKMQDDKDDGVTWLVDEGLVDPDRVAMYGFSYGGYAAMAAIVRDNPPYQCAIAGAGLAELRTFQRITFEGSRYVRELQNPTVAGLSPLEHVDNASVPILIFHGNRDQIVPIEQSEKLHAALIAAGKDSTYVEIADYGHGNSLSSDKQAQVLQLLEDFLASDKCGPGGL